MAITRHKRPFSVNNYSVQLSFGTSTDRTFFNKCSKITKTYETSDYGDGLTNRIYKLPGASRISDVTLQKPFTEDDAIIYGKLLKANANMDDITVTIQPMHRDGYYSKPVGGQIILQFCNVIECSSIEEIDTIGSAPQMLSVTLSVGNIMSQGSIPWWEDPT